MSAVNQSLVRQAQTQTSITGTQQLLGTTYLLVLFTYLLFYKYAGDNNTDDRDDSAACITEHCATQYIAYIATL